PRRRRPPPPRGRATGPPGTARTGRGRTRRRAPGPPGAPAPPPGGRGTTASGPPRGSGRRAPGGGRRPGPGARPGRGTSRRHQVAVGAEPEARRGDAGAGRRVGEPGELAVPQVAPAVAVAVGVVGLARVGG